MMKTLCIPYPESLAAVANQSTNGFEAEARLAMAMKLFEMGRVTSGQAASLAGVGRAEFLLSCRRFGAASVKWDEDELAREFHTP